VHGFPTDKNDRCVFTRDNRGEVMIFFEKGKVLGVEARMKGERHRLIPLSL
jgi:hypothetical protein